MSWNQMLSVIKRGLYGLVLCSCVVSMYGCSIPNLDLSERGLPDFDIELPMLGEFSSNIREVSPPRILEQLKTELSSSTPVVKIIEPQDGITIDTQTLEVKVSVTGLSLYKESHLGLGPHVTVVLDDQAPLELHDIKTPITIKDIQPGTHTIRAFAAYPWHESFKNPEAYAQSSFNILTSSQKYAVGTSPVLTSSSIQDSYTAEPILLDFIVRQAKSHPTGSTDPRIKVPDQFNVKATLNNQSFVIDDANGRVYVTGLKPGQNWLKLELEDHSGNLQAVPFSEQVFAFQYVPEQSSPLGDLFSDQLSLQNAGAIVGRKAVISDKNTPDSVSSITPITDASEKKQQDSTTSQPLTSRQAPNIPPSGSSAKTIPSMGESSLSSSPSKLNKPPAAIAPQKPSRPEAREQESTQTNLSNSSKADSGTAPLSSVQQDIVEKVSKANATPSNRDSPMNAKKPLEAQENRVKTSVTPKKESPAQLRPDHSKLGEPKIPGQENQLENQFQSLKLQSQEQVNQRLQSWSDRFQQFKADVTATSKITLKDPYPTAKPAEASSSLNSSSTKTAENLDQKVPDSTIKP